MKKYKKMFVNYQSFSSFAQSYFSLKNGCFFYVDIETTGLSAAHDYIYLIGTVHYEGDQLCCIQRFANNPDEEAEILLDFLEFQSRFLDSIDYNGKNFDWKFIEKRCQVRGLNTSFSLHRHDCYQEAKPLKHLLKLTSLKQTSMEEYLHLSRDQDVSGKDCILLYRNYVAYHQDSDVEKMLQHNEYDLTALVQITAVLSYLQLYHGSYQVTDAAIEDSGTILAHLHLYDELPQIFSFSNSVLYLTGEKSEVKLALKCIDGKLYKFYKNYKDYYYLPQEDTAIHKSVGAYVARNFRKQATIKTCYTKFIPDISFIQNKAEFTEYLIETLPFLIDMDV